MSARPIVWSTIFLFLLAGSATVNGAGLDAVQSVTAGERVANYLQAYMTKLGTIVEAKSSGGLFEGVQTYRVVLDYDPDQKVLEISVIGMAEDEKVEKDMLETVREIVLKMNPKIEKKFRVTLRDADLSMVYIFAKSGDLLLRYRDGHYSREQVPAKTAQESTPGK